MNHTVWPLAVPLYRGRRTVSFERSTCSALSKTRLFRGSSPLSCPSPVAAPGLSSALTGAEPYQAIPTRTTAMMMKIEVSNLVLPLSVIEVTRMCGYSVHAPANEDHQFASTHSFCRDPSLTCRIEV